jgi:zinc transport system substrate-binding protein
VYVVNYPLKYFAERIGGELVHVHFPAPAEEDPAFWMPDPETIAEYQRADLILLNGAEYARWTSKVTLPESKICDTSAAFRDQVITIEDAVTHSHGPEGEHAHGDTAFTIWLDPQLAICQADAIRLQLTKLLPEHEALFEENFTALRGDLQAMDQALSDIVAADPDRPLVASHPVYQYLTRRYGLNVQSVHWEPGQPPSDAMWDELQQRLQEHPAEWMVWEGQPLPETASRLKELGVQSVVFDPCGNVPAEGDYLAIQRANVSNLKMVFRP